MKKVRAEAGLSVVGRLPEGYIILCKHNGDEYSFLVRSLGISVECPHCGTTRCGPDLAAEGYLRASATNHNGAPSRFERAAAE